MKRFTTMVLVLGLALFSLTAYGNSDSGLKLKNWYDQAFGFAVDEVVGDYLAGVIQLKKAVSKDKKEQALLAEDELASFSNLLSENSGKEVENYQKRYIDIANATEQRLKQQDFSEVENEQKKSVEAELESEIDEILEDALR
ncbi:hypothetical protein [Planococcus sp. 107-1]|uniref:hypothetical protein n=1 Tax=Planococcus sp. 107-1 TaxID=2908840 RepID=UPI001F27EB2C|nr:hypothetical protein [Planococcus sp. 107-1]UJF26136.1 hypothetical protein L0M13_13290 [Planococcus sp. 107-1]